MVGAHLLALSESWRETLTNGATQPRLRRHAPLRSVGGLGVVLVADDIPR